MKKAFSIFLAIWLVVFSTLALSGESVQAQTRTFPINVTKTADGVLFEPILIGVKIDRIQWDFGDDTTSDEIRPVHKFTDNKVYSVFASAWFNCAPEGGKVSCDEATGSIQYGHGDAIFKSLEDRLNDTIKSMERIAPIFVIVGLAIYYILQGIGGPAK